MRSLLTALTLAALSAAVGLLACAKQSVDARPAHVATSPIELVVGDPNPVLPPVAPQPRAERAAEVAVAPAPSPEPESEPLPTSWTGPIVPGLSFTDAIHKARGARDAYARLAAPQPSTTEATTKTWFVQAQSFVDQASRMYAAAFHAPDAPRDGRIDAIAEAAELDMTMARNLDEAGLASLPAAWRADPAVASTFEDIAVGPTRRWRDEARVLARQCIDSAHESGVLTDAARRCAALRTGAPPKLTKRAARSDAGAPCACAAGDPLCSASLGGWCGTAGR